jgi:hypothetical protein
LSEARAHAIAIAAKHREEVVAVNAVGAATAVGTAILAGAVLGTVLRQWLPGHHLDTETKDIIKSGIALVSTLSALVLGLVIGTAKGSFDAQNADIQAAAAKLVLLDATLREVGAGANPVRVALAATLGMRLDEMWGATSAPAGVDALARHADAAVRLREAVAGAGATTEGERQALAKARQLADDLLQTRVLAVGHATSPVTGPLVVLLSFWFAVIALGLNLFAPRNPVIWVMNGVCALSVAGAIFLILEMERPYGGVIRLSDAPLRAALSEMQR